MNKQQKIPLTGQRKTVLACILLLSTAGFLTQWQLCGSRFSEALIQTIVPAFPGMILYALEYRERLVERTFLALRDLKLLGAALPVLLACLGIQMKPSGSSLGIYWGLSFAVCVCFIQQSLRNDPDGACAAVLLCFLVFCGLSWHLDLYTGGILAICFLVFPLSVRMVKNGCHSSDSGTRYALFFLVCLILIGTMSGTVLDKMFYGAITPDTDTVLSACINLLLFLKPGSTVQLDSAVLKVLRSSHPLGYLTALYGPRSALPILLILVILLFAAGDLSHSNRNMAPLAMGCFYLLLLRTADALLAFIHIELGLGDSLPFFAGNMADRTLDFLLIAVALMPLKPARLSSLDPKDPDFPAQEESSLSLLPHNLSGLVVLCQYVYNHASERGWELLLREYQDLMDSNSLRIMVLRANSLFATNYFRRTFPTFFRMAGNAEITPLPQELDTIFTDNSFIDTPANYETNGTTLVRYWGQKDALLIPPCWLSIGPDAFASSHTLKALSVPHTVQRICSGAFRRSGLEHCELRSGIEEIGPFAFAETNLKAIHLPDTLQRMEHGAFAGTTLEQVRIPGSVRKVSEFCFENNTSLRCVTLETGVEEIGAFAFRNCHELCELNIPDSVNWIHSSAFEGCSRLLHVNASSQWKECYPDLYMNCIRQTLEDSCNEEV